MTIRSVAGGYFLVTKVQKILSFGVFLEWNGTSQSRVGFGLTRSGPEPSPPPFFLTLCAAGAATSVSL